MNSIERGTVVVLTRNHRARLLRTLKTLQALPEGWPIIVVDNGSTDGTARAVGRHFPAVLLIRSRRNIGAAARNIAVAYAHTPYIAFTNDDSHWEPGARTRTAWTCCGIHCLAITTQGCQYSGYCRTPVFCGLGRFMRPAGSGHPCSKTAKRCCWRWISLSGAGAWCIGKT